MVLPATRIFIKATRALRTSHSCRQITRRHPGAGGKLAAKECGARRVGIKAPKLRKDGGSLAHIRIQTGRSPEARQRRREAARR